ncbi:hypothetical protein V2J09_009929, partial [Rumex salicifolius]
VTKRDLSRQIDRADCSLNDLSDINVATRHEARLLFTAITALELYNFSVSHLRGEMETFDVNIQSVREVVESLDAINMKVMRLVDVAKNIERRRSPDALQGAQPTASKPAIERPKVLLSSRSLSMPPELTLEPPSPVASSSNEIQYQLNGASSATGLKDIQEMSLAANAVASSPKISDYPGIGNPLSAGASGDSRALRIVGGGALPLCPGKEVEYLPWSLNFVGFVD